MIETETPEMADGETMGGLRAKPGRAPADAVAFSELDGVSAMEARAEMWST